MALKTYKFVDPGSPLISLLLIRPDDQRIKVTDPGRLPHALPIGSLARVHSHAPRTGAIIVWVLDEKTYERVILEVPLVLMGQYFRQHPHGIFPHFA